MINIGELINSNEKRTRSRMLSSVNPGRIINEISNYIKYEKGYVSFWNTTRGYKDVPFGKRIPKTS